MTVEPISGEPLRFHVESWSRSGLKHLVDFTSGTGVCSCENYVMSIGPKIRTHVINIGECWHIKKAREFAMRMLAINLGLNLPKDELDYLTSRLFQRASQSARRLTFANRASKGQTPASEGSMGDCVPHASPEEEGEVQASEEGSW